MTNYERCSDEIEKDKYFSTLSFCKYNIPLLPFVCPLDQAAIVDRMDQDRTNIDRNINFLTARHGRCD